MWFACLEWRENWKGTKCLVSIYEFVCLYVCLTSQSFLPSLPSLFNLFLLPSSFAPAFISYRSLKFNFLALFFLSLLFIALPSPPPVLYSLSFCISPFLYPASFPFSPSPLLPHFPHSPFFPLTSPPLFLRLPIFPTLISLRAREEKATAEKMQMPNT